MIVIKQFFKSFSKSAEMSAKRKLSEIDSGMSPAGQKKLSAFFTVETHPAPKKCLTVTTSENLVADEKPLEKVESEKEELPKPKAQPVVVKQIPVKTGILRYLKDDAWYQELQPEFAKPYFKSIEKFLDDQYRAGKTIFPQQSQIFQAFNLTPFSELKVVILGQDPYHGVGQAHGLSFSVPLGVDAPPSLKNIFKELSTDIDGFAPPNHGCLESWARQGVLLLNASLTVEAHKANSHSHIGWQTFTDAVIRVIAEKRRKIVFILWGGFAAKKASVIQGKTFADRGHCVIRTAHPSPLSVTKFFGCKCFSKANSFLETNNIGAINWKIDSL